MQYLLWVAICPTKIAVTTEEGEKLNDNLKPIIILWHREPLSGSQSGKNLQTLMVLDGTGENNKSGWR